MARKGDGIYKRGTTWWLDAIISGKRHQASLGKNIPRNVALDLAQIERSKILRGEAGIGRKKKDIPFDKAAEEFLQAAKVNTRPNTYRGYQQHLEGLKTFFAGKHLSEVSAFLIEKYKQKRIADGVTVGLNRELGTLKTLFNWSIDKGKFEGGNPARKVKRLKESPGRERFLEIDEEKRLLEAASEPLRTIIRAGIYAGLRIPSEVLNLKWSDVDLSRDLLTVQGVFAKNGKTQTVPISRELHDALAGLKRASKNGAECVFTKRDGKPFKTVQNIFRTAAKNAKLEDISPHVCRHTFGSRLGMAGVDAKTIMELGRWANLSMVQRYVNLSPNHKTDAIRKLSQFSAGQKAAENSPSIITTPTEQKQNSYPCAVAVNGDGGKA
jgi:integrase